MGQCAPRGTHAIYKLSGGPLRISEQCFDACYALASMFPPCTFAMELLQIRMPVPQCNVSTGFGPIAVPRFTCHFSLNGKQMRTSNLECAVGHCTFICVRCDSPFGGVLLHINMRRESLVFRWAVRFGKPYRANACFSICW